MREWLPKLNASKKWFYEGKELKAGEVVLVVSQDTPPGQWPQGIITEIAPGKDGHVRVARIKIGDHIYERSSPRLCPLECDVDC